jgi:hypothetical protein
MVKRRDAYGVLMGKHEGTVPLRRPRNMWEDNTEMDIQEVEWEGLDLINVAQDRVRWRAVLIAVMKFWLPYNSEFFSTSRGSIGL